jgi:hypothetical protein
MPLWDFSSLVSQSRRNDLLEVSGWPEIVNCVTNGSIEFVSAEPRQNPPCLGCHRAFFRFRLPQKDYDAFFNSPVGYRAQFCISAETGEQRNRELLAALEPGCLASITGHKLVVLSPELIQASLQGWGAKIWISEADLANLSGVHIRCARWVGKAAAAAHGTISDQAARSKACMGVLAPVGTILEVKGAWIRSDGVGCRDPAKAGRAQEIHEYGFS